MRKPSKKTLSKNFRLQTNEDLRRFCKLADKRYFNGKLPISRILFDSGLGEHCHANTHPIMYRRVLGGKCVHEVQMYHITVNTRLRRWRDLVRMTVYHEMVHVELYALGLSSKENSCLKDGNRFNQRMAELAQAGAFNGLW